MRRVVAAVAALLGCASCGISGLGLVQDDRIDLQAPADRSEVTLPLTVSWTVTDPDLAGRVAAGDASFAVFVDRPPQPPGRTVAWLFRDDDACRRGEDCVTGETLARARIIPTSDTSIVLDSVPRRHRDLHEVTVVLVDADGRRLGESAFRVEFFVESGGAS